MGTPDIPSPADEQEERNHEIRRTTRRRIFVLIAWWVVAQAGVLFLLCAGLVGPRNDVAVAALGGLITCDVLLFGFAGALAAVALTNWHTLSWRHKFFGLAPGVITLLEFPITCVGCFLMN